MTTVGCEAVYDLGWYVGANQMLVGLAFVGFAIAVIYTVGRMR